MQNIYWDLLKKNREKSKDRRIETLFQSDKNRFKEFAIEKLEFAKIVLPFIESIGDTNRYNA